MYFIVGQLIVPERIDPVCLYFIIIHYVVCFMKVPQRKYTMDQITYFVNKPLG